MANQTTPGNDEADYNKILGNYIQELAYNEFIDVQADAVRVDLYSHWELNVIQKARLERIWNKAQLARQATGMHQL